MAARPWCWFVALLVVATTLGPVLYVVLGGFRTNAQLAESPGRPARTRGCFEQLPAGADQLESFWRRRSTSTVIAVVTTVGVVVLGLMAAFVLARYHFRGREALYTFFVLGLLFPLTVAILPLYIIMLRNLRPARTPGSGVILPADRLRSCR